MKKYELVAPVSNVLIASLLVLLNAKVSGDSFLFAKIYTLAQLAGTKDMMKDFQSYSHDVKLYAVLITATILVNSIFDFKRNASYAWLRGLVIAYTSVIFLFSLVVG